MSVADVGKSFVMHLRGGTTIDVLSGVTFAVAPAECVALVGPSGAGKSTILRMIYANYRCDRGQILVSDGDAMTDLRHADPRTIRRLRRRTIGYVSQFLRVIPRIPTLAIVAAAGRDAGLGEADATARAGALLHTLNIPRHLWDLPPATFSGGEQQRVNIARGLIGGHAILLLDEPTASLDVENRDVVIDLILAAKARGTAILGIFHDTDVRARVADRGIDVSRFTP